MEKDNIITNDYEFLQPCASESEIGKIVEYIDKEFKTDGTSHGQYENCVRLSNFIKNNEITIGEIEAERLLNESTKLNEMFNLDFDFNSPVILITGGSQGAQIFNEIIPQALANLQMLDLQVLHLAGKGKTQSALDIYKNVPFKYCVLEETSNMELFYGAADFAICRSGGGTLSELAMFKVAALLIPYPYAAELHQDANADYFVANNGAIKLDNQNLDAQKVSDVLQKLFEEEQALSQMRSNVAALAVPQAAKVFLNAIESKL